MSTRRTHPRRGAGGFTLVEMLVTISILGTAIVVIIGGLLTLVVSDDTHERVVRAGTILHDYAEAVKAADYEECTDPQAYRGVRVGAAGYDLAVTAVDCWNGDTPATFTPGTTGGARDRGVARITLRVATADAGQPRPVAETAVIIKRDRAGP